MGWIYKITCKKNGKLYIGKTEHNNAEVRWKEHRQDYQRERCEKRPLYAAMNKYGVENFAFETIEEIEDSEELCKRESYWINKYHTYVGFDDCNGYNATLGGDGKPYKEYDINLIISLYNETHDIGLISSKCNLEYSYVYLLLKENGVKILSSKETYIIKYSKKVYQIDIYSKKIIQIFNNPTEISDLTDFNHRLLYNAIKGIRNSHYAYGFLWYYENDYMELKENNLLDDEFNKYIIKNKEIGTNHKNVICLNTLEVFQTIKFANSKYNISTVGLCVNKRQKTAGVDPITGEKLRWMYYKDYLKLYNNNVLEELAI